ncbi:hypothetical protein OE766_09605 [Pararhizobium sp. YC-54]|uniref:hypothetical protein n=1 Tax=Pararhizobium sp. YC-54 TaxID=2986920 RepID=UPI0021F74504|nr:hypothetical protein [Pararhizobium sp. YC-54]MCV9998502.1 hypothetical protein [Pararhizobium sp. YC-54]
MIIDVTTLKLKKSHLMPLSKEPLAGLLTLETDQGQVRFEINEDSANNLLDEVLALFGVPRPPSADLKTGAGL